MNKVNAIGNKEINKDVITLLMYKVVNNACKDKAKINK